MHLSFPCGLGCGLIKPSAGIGQRTAKGFDRFFVDEMRFVARFRDRQRGLVRSMNFEMSDLVNSIFAIPARTPFEGSAPVEGRIVR